MMTLSRFARVDYDKTAADQQNKLRQDCKNVEDEIEGDPEGQKENAVLENFYLELTLGKPCPYRELAKNALAEVRSYIEAKRIDLALIKLEETYCWAGKCIRMEMIARLEEVGK